MKSDLPFQERSVLARLVPDEPFPVYAFVPGQSPHPVSDPGGHSFGVAHPPPPALDPARWRDSRAYLFGIDLFNAGYYWESHEAWEGLWHAAGRKGVLADFLKGLIKLAAAGVKRRAGRPDGVRSLAGAAARHWTDVARTIGGETYLGLGLPGLVALAESIRCAGWPDEVPLLLPNE